MPRDRRRELISAIEDARQSRLLCYVTGDRQGLETKIAADIFPFMYQHLSDFRQAGTIDLFLYTSGGDAIAGWGLVNLLREFCKKLNVIIPFKALSCGTLIALGADSIPMGRGGQLSPIDPSVGSPFNPPAPGPQQPGRINLLPVSVEDMLGYLDLVREEAKIKEEGSISRIIQLLSDKVHPLALGAVYRDREKTKMLATRLMEYHLTHKEKIEKTVATLTKDLPIHSYLIGRKEAKNIIETVVDIPEDLEKTIWSLYLEYEQWFQLTTPYNPEPVLGSAANITSTFYRAAVESLAPNRQGLKTHVFRTIKELRRIQTTQPGVPMPITGVQERVIDEGWAEETVE